MPPRDIAAGLGPQELDLGGDPAGPGGLVHQPVERLVVDKERVVVPGEVNAGLGEIQQPFRQFVSGLEDKNEGFRGEIDLSGLHVLPQFAKNRSNSFSTSSG